MERGKDAARKLSLACVLLLSLCVLPQSPVCKKALAEEAPYGPWVDAIEIYKVEDDLRALQLLEQNLTQLHLPFVTSNLYYQFKDSPNLSYKVAFGLYDELTFNPVGPEFSDGRLNPFSNPKVREAVNYLVNRTYIANEIFRGMAVPKFVPLVSAFPEYWRLVDVIKPLEVKYDYNFSKAREMIFEELAKMGASYNDSDGKWYYKGEPLTIKFLIRTEDERRQIGDYVADQLEKLGFTVERMYKSSREAAPIWLRGNPADGQWHVYTGGWITAAVSRDDADVWASFYTPLGMPYPLWQAYKPDPTFYEVARKLWNREWGTWEERMELMRQAVPLSLEDSVRVWLVDLVSPAFFRSEVEAVFDRAGGPYTPLWSRTVRYKQVVGGVLHVTEREVFVDPWNPVVRSGWLYDEFLKACTSDSAVLANPYNGLPMPNTFVNATVVLEGSEQGRVVSSSEWLTLAFTDRIPVPQDAWYGWDAQNKKVVYAPEGVYAKAKVVVNYGYPLGSVKYHDGSTMTLADWVAMWPLKFERADPASPLYDESYLEEFEGFRRNFRGMRVLSASPLVIEYYTNYTQREAEFIVSYVAEWPSVPWHVVALGVKAEEEGKMAFSSHKAGAKGVPWANYIAGESLSILGEELSDALETGYRPLLASEYATQEEAVERYRRLAEWYNAHGHFWVSSGPFLLDALDYESDRAVLKAFREYPYKADRWSWLMQPSEIEQLTVTACSPIHLLVTDSLGRSVGFDPETGKVVNEIPGAMYSGPRVEGEVVVIPGPSGAYKVSAIGLSEGEYKLRVEWVSFATAKFTSETFTGRISAGAVDAYKVLVGPAGARTSILASVDIEPKTLNAKSKGEFVTAYIELPAGLRPEDIDLATVRIGPVPAVTDPKYSFVTNPEEYVVDHDGDGILERMVKFDRKALIEYLQGIAEQAGKCNVTLTLTGYVNGKPFEGSSVVVLIGG